MLKGLIVLQLVKMLFFFSSLTSVVFPSELTSIAVGAFNYCPSLTSVNLSNCTNLTKLNGVFSSCNSLTSVVLPNGLTEIGEYAFSGCSKLTSINFPSSLRLIGNEAFYLCSSLDSVNLLECINLSSIFNMCFRNCSALTSVIFPKNLQSIGENAFGDCPNLSSITWDAWIGTIGIYDDSLSGVCPNGGTVTVTNPDGYDSVDLLQYLVNRAGLPESWLPAPELPDDVYIIENNVLKGFTSAFLANPSAYRLCDTMEIPANVTSIEEGAFIDDLTLEQPSSTIPSFITKLTFAEGSNCSTIGSYVFGLSPLTSATLPDGLTTIGDSAFAYSKITSVIFPSALTNVGEHTFDSCESLASVKFSRSLKTIGNYCFENCPLLTEVDLLNSRNLTSIGDYAFNFDSSLTSVSFPSSLLTIGENTFQNCSALTSVILTNAINLQSIGIYAFQNCLSLRSIDFTKSTNLSYIGPFAFRDCSTLSSVVLPTNLETISNSCFAGCSSLTSVTFPSHLSRIEMYAFNGCSSLTSVSFPKDLLTVESSAFNDCSNLNSITWDAWNGNTNLQLTSFSGVCQDGGTVTVTNPSGEYDSRALLNYLLSNGGLPESWRITGPELPESVYNIDDNGVLLGFKAGVDLNKYKDTCDTMKIPARVTSINEKAFYTSPESTIPSFIKKLTFAEGSNCSTIGGYAFYKCQSLTDVKLPNNLKTIHSFVFNDCTSLKTINLPQSLTSLDDYSFMRTGLISADLSNCVNLTSIGSYSFSENQSLTSVILPRKLNYIGGYAFSENPLLNYIAWDIPSSFAVTINSRWCFDENATTGKVESLNSSVSSQNLLDWLKEKCSFINDNDWTAKS